MMNMNVMNEVEVREANGGAIKTMNCKICGESVTGNFWTRYYHCLKHSAKGVLSAVEFVALCFGLAAL